MHYEVMGNECITIIGGGLAGSEAAWQAAEHGVRVRLYEMRPEHTTGAHTTGDLAELVCSNSLGSDLPDRATGLLLRELETARSLLVRCARENAVPAGGALAVDRRAFAQRVTAAVAGHPRIDVVRAEVTAIPEESVAVIATGPLTSPALSESLRRLIGEDLLYFFDALAPIVRGDSIDFNRAFAGSRYDRGERETGDYINCPLTEAEYDRFVKALADAERIPLRAFEQRIAEGVRAGLHTFFESCLPIEIMAERGPRTLAFGPLRPVGIRDPRTGRRPHAVVQLRQDNRAAELYNLVGFQTNLKQSEQRRVFRMIPGLGQAEFERYGQMHRNTFINAPMCLEASLRFRNDPRLFFAGQLTGVEGYAGNIGTGLLAGRNATRAARGETPAAWPPETMLGALCRYISRSEPEHFQPMKANFGILPPLDDGARRSKRERAQAMAERALKALDETSP